MKNRNELLHIIQKYDFALYDLMLYLDTHPHCREAQRLFDRYRSQRAEAVQEYTKQFGPLQAIDSCTDGKWNWGEGPYPWEKEANLNVGV